MVGQVVRRAAQELREAGIADASLEAEVLLMHALGIDRTRLYLRWNEPLPSSAREVFRRALRRRLRGEPTAYIVGHREFYGLELQVSSAALIPRPETELVVEEALRLARSKSGGRIRIADIGSGCGAIACALAAHLPDAIVYAVDISPQALSLARCNARRLGLKGIRFLWGDLLSPLPELVDIIAANLPYVPTAEWQRLPPEIRLHEPPLALDGGPDGLRYVERLLMEAPWRLLPGGAVVLEIGHDQGPAVADMARRSFPTAEIEIKKDLAGLERVAIISIA